jgi:hypothetical protein
MNLELLEGLSLREINSKLQRLDLLEGICENQLETMESQAKTIDDQLEVIEEYSDRVVALEKLLEGK